MFTLVFLVCMAGSPDKCHETDIAYDMQVMQCAIAGQQYAAEWLSQHPGLVLKRTRCVQGQGL